MSNINTSAINVNYPIPGENNTSQGFRTNFAAIKSNIDTAADEISNLQGAVIVKSALTGTAIDNNMNGTLISNALTKNFRGTTYNLGNALSGSVTIDVSKADAQYGAISGNVTLAFTGWSADGRNDLDLQLAVGNANAVVTFPTSVYNGANSVNICHGASTLEHMAVVGNVATVSAAANVCQLDFHLSSVDCGNTVTIEPVNRPRRTTEIRQRTPTAVGLVGDKAGDIAVDTGNIYICVGSYDSTTHIWARSALTLM
jgi:hypothetical protein